MALATAPSARCISEGETFWRMDSTESWGTELRRALNISLSRRYCLSAVSMASRAVSMASLPMA